MLYNIIKMLNMRQLQQKYPHENVKPNFNYVPT